MTEKMASEKEFDPRHYVQGRIRIPPQALSLPSRWFTYAADTGPVKVASGASATVQIQIDDSSYFLVEQIHILSSLQTVLQDTATAQITDTTTSRAWSDTAVPLRDLAGLGASPKILSDPNLLRPTSTLNIQITNSTGSAATFYVALIGRKIYGLTEDLANLMLQRLWFQYVMPFASLAASSVDTQGQVKIYNESDFMVKKMLSQQLINAVIGLTSGTESGEVTMILRDTTGDRNYMNQKLPVRLLLSSYASEAISAAGSWSNNPVAGLIKPITVRRNGILAAFLDNKSTDAIATAFNITFEGIRMFAV